MKIYVLLILAATVSACLPDVSVKETDVLVIGGGTGGVSAGIQAARSGANTLIVEETPWLGGMLTAAGVSGTDGNHRLPSGIWNEFRELLRQHYGGAEALNTGWVSNTLFEPHVGADIFKTMASEGENPEVLYGYYPVEITKEGNRVTGAVFRNAGGKELRVKAKVTVDATDLGDGLAMAGAAYHLGLDAKAATGESLALAEADDLVQDLTWVAVLKDYGKGADMTIEKPAGYDAELYRGCCVADNKGDCDRMLHYGRLPGNKYMMNWPANGNDIYLNVVEMDHDRRAAELRKAADRTLGFVYYIQTALGYRHLGLADDEFDTSDKLAYQPYHREGRRLDGIVRFTFNHVSNPYEQPEPLYRTGISVGDYPVDHHHRCKPSPPGLRFLPVPSFCVPLGALIPESVDGLIVADKAISVTNLINGSTRLQPVVLLTGQAAGVLAALSVRTDTRPRDVPVRDVQQALLDVQAYIMPLYDVTPDDPDFAAIQKIAATGILKTRGEPYQWANRTWFDPDTCITVAEFCEGLESYSFMLAVRPEDGILSVGKCIEILSSLKGQDLTTEITDNWADVSRRPYRPDLPAAKREVAALVDRILRPFLLQIDHRGFLTTK